MPETVCVTVEQLRDIEVQCDDEGRLNWCPACEKLGMLPHEPDCWLAKAIAQAERLKDWRPVVEAASEFDESCGDEICASPTCRVARAMNAYRDSAGKEDE